VGVTYRVPARDGEAEIEVKRSRFRCTVRRVSGEEEARAVVDGLRREHWDARHTCSAFRLGPPAELGLGSPVERSNDDGEPAGTAGAPMLEVVRGAGLSDVVVVVTRWFGGVLLGTGGLARAYSDAVRAGLDEVGTRSRELMREYTVAASYDTAGRLETDLRSQGFAVLDTVYADAVTLRLGAAPDETDRLAGVLAGLTAGAGVLVSAGESWVDRP
jgi:uncharacterized YigZ family protein